jgi:hypothetical protein
MEFMILVGRVGIEATTNGLKGIGFYHNYMNIMYL